MKKEHINSMDIVIGWFLVAGWLILFILIVSLDLQNFLSLGKNFLIRASVAATVLCAASGMMAFKDAFNKAMYYIIRILLIVGVFYYIFFAKNPEEINGFVWLLGILISFCIEGFQLVDMIQKRKKVKSEKQMELPAYNFDWDKEIAIYKRVSKIKMTTKEKRLSENYDFYSYDEWRKYIIDKYKNITVKSLYDVKRFFKHKENIESHVNGAYAGILVPWIFTVLTISYSSITLKNMIGNSIAEILITIVSIAICFSAPLYLLKVLIERYLMECQDGAMIKDYQDIINDMIAEKEEMNK